MGVPFVKGHGTENDFVLIPDPDGRLVITDAQVRALCDRRAGIGADGVIVVRPAASGGYFMDYRNADGSLAEMCGNGARVFARYLVDLGWERAGSFPFLTRGGVRTAELGPGGDVSIDMGPVRVGPAEKAELQGEVFAGTAVDVGNPHLVCLLDDESRLAALDLTRAPAFDAESFPHGVNVEFVVPVGPDHVRMRVFERGSGETRSCGTGTVAAAAAFLRATGGSGSRVTVDVPGGTVVVTFGDQGATLTGPAVLVASGQIDQAFWIAAGQP
ncbi:diaminopimelate epimerase [Nakamurella panacisegetis]|uniref:Diaminopimelate epimerase n=1 Tax=Nakamurella panacisegetis TaxID=1090615 RepID=A0A1H0Q523_9ACTN|nr:diaminopimelate epimerase [Nakamurella panacisegetis]SDP12502.1 diaminopimelate epimerase [Nakamurella panacisegetis]